MVLGERSGKKKETSHAQKELSKGTWLWVPQKVGFLTSKSQQALSWYFHVVIRAKRHTLVLGFFVAIYSFHHISGVNKVKRLSDKVFSN